MDQELRSVSKVLFPKEKRLDSLLRWDCDTPIGRVNFEYGLHRELESMQKEQHQRQVDNLKLWTEQQREKLKTRSVDLDKP